MSSPTITLKKVKNSDAKLLYELLAEREPKTFIIHKKMSTYEEHVKFVKSKPYSKWYIIELGNKSVGSISLTHKNEIGIWIKKNMHDKGIGSQALKILMKKNPGLRYLANINPKNRESIRFFEKSGFKLIQYTYELIN